MELEITLQVPRILQRFSGGSTEFRIRASTPEAVLRELSRVQPEVHACVCDETGALRRHIKVFVNEQMLLEPRDFQKPLKSDDIVSIFQAVSGG